MTMSHSVIERRDGAALFIHIHRPDDANRIDSECMDAMHAALDAADRDASVRVIVVAGNAEHFCSGGRIDGHPDGTVLQQLDFGRAFCELQRRLGQTRAPTLAAVRGHCTAGGMSILAACDLAVVSSSAEFAFPEIDHGLFPMLAMAVAHGGMASKVLFDLFYSGRRFSASEAQRFQLVNDVVAPEAFEQAVRERVEMLASKRASAIALGRKAYYAMTAMQPSARLDYAQTMLTALIGASALDDDFNRRQT